MPELQVALDRALEILEDNFLVQGITRQNYLEIILKNVDQEDLDVEKLKRIIALCVKNLKENSKRPLVCLNIITTILKRLKPEQTVLDFVPAAEAVLHILEAASRLIKAETLQLLCFNTLSAFPHDALAKVVCNSNHFWNIFQLYCNSNIAVDVRLQPVNLAHRMLKTLSSEEREIFAKTGMTAYFSRLIPFVMDFYKTHVITPMSMVPLETLEMWAEELIKFDYADDEHWQTVLENIYSPNLYPTFMKTLLSNGSAVWHRLWIVYIKLLKTQITMNKPGVGSPINSMLPVVETAFKMDVTNRCRAFQCWNVLIDNFSSETNEIFINKRIKLLIIPLRSNNAKVEETALAKLNTWWHLIKQYENRMDDRILYPFLHFCFGRHIPDKVSVVPGLISPKLKKNCVKALVELVGHVNCEGCGLVARLKGRIINTNEMVNHWNDWVYSLKMAIKISAEDIGLGTQQITCAWKSFVMTVSELPENNIRKDLFGELLAMINELTEECKGKSNMADVVVNVLISSLFEEDNIRQLLFVKESKNGPLQQITDILINPALDEAYVKVKYTNLLKIFKSIAESISKESPSLVDKYIEWLLKDLPPNNSTLHLWAALADVFPLRKANNDTQAISFLLWPLTHLDMLTHVDTAALVWNTTYLNISMNNNVIDKDNRVTKILQNENHCSAEATYFKLCVLLATIKAKLVKNNTKISNKEVQLLFNVTSKYNEYNQFKQVFPMLIDTLNLLTSALEPPLKSEYLKNIMLILRNALEFCNKQLKSKSAYDNEIVILTVVNSIQTLLKIQESSETKLTIIDELIECRSLSNMATVRSNLDNILKFILADENTDLTTSEKIKTAMKGPEPCDKDTGITHTAEITEPNESEFTTPVPKSEKKNLKKKETSIVNTVVENGEEFAVIKSNWKFNPKKLTENQKEKLQRKREDIPALYQDLSQSQDEFKLKSWKTDSQDASTTNSTSTSVPSNEEASKILKNMPCTDIVPKIIDNFFSENLKNDVVVETKNTNSPQSNKKDSHANLHVKMPRMALKDRVFRNVRNLIEKSVDTKEGAKNIGLLNETISTNIFNTPETQHKQSKNLANSAPPKILADRPARVKRKPKKFDDTEVYLLKKRRSSNSLSDSQPCDDLAEENTVSSATNTNICSNKLTEAEKVDTKTKSNENELSTSLSDSEIGSHELKPTTTTKPEVNQVLEKSPSVDKEDSSNKNNYLENSKPANDTESNCSNSDDISGLKQFDSVEGQIQPNETETKTLNNELTPKTMNKRRDQNEAKPGKRKSRIEKELAIDMVEGHPFLKLQSDRRVTRKCLSNTPNGTRRKNLTEKLNKSKIEPKHSPKSKKEDTHAKDTSNTVPRTLSISVCETQDICPNGTQDLSQDVIESSQDSMTTVSAKSLKYCTKIYTSTDKTSKTVDETQNLIDSQDINTTIGIPSQENKDDTDIPANKTAVVENVSTNLTEEMDTEPMDEKSAKSQDVILINDEDDPVIVLNTEDDLPGPDTLEIANADTLPTDASQLTDSAPVNKQEEIITGDDKAEKDSNAMDTTSPADIEEDRTITLTDITLNEDSGNASSPSKDEEQRQKDFLNNTLEISPIKTLSPIEPKSPSPETSSDYLVVKLSGPVQMNGEPIENSNSPEIFTEDKVSPDKRDQSPPRAEVTHSNSSPSSSLSLKKNRPQVRGGGRAAQMLGLCVPDRMQSIMNMERPEPEEPKKGSPANTPVRRNLRMLYNSATNDSDDFEDNEESEHFLKFKRSLPTADCSPAGPILKRKLAEITDEASVSPANKRKRVSFHDPVSTSVSVQKYIETGGVRSPQNSALKRFGRQIRSNSHMKSPKRLDNLFILDSVLTTAIASFNESDLRCNETPLSSLDQTPVVEVVKTSELNDTDPIFPDLIDCKDSIQDISAELSSPGMSLLLVKELEGKVETIGDLAKLTELEVNRLCIKAPKIEVVRKVLSDYSSKKNDVTSEIPRAEPVVEIIKENEIVTCNVEVQTEVLTSETETQTSLVLQRLSSTQTDNVATSQKSVQTDEPGRKSTEDMIKLCLKDKKNFVEKLNNELEEASKLRLAATLSVENCTDLLMNKMTSGDTSVILNRVIQRNTELHSNGQNGNKGFAVLQNYLCDNYDAKELILFCSQLLKKMHDNVD